MPVTLSQFGLDSFSVADRLELVELLWDSLDGVPDPLPDWHVREL